MSGFGFYSGEPDCMYHLARFLEEHSLCGGTVTFINEHKVIDEDIRCVSWTPKPR